jgi:hypothetical protein
MLVRICFLVLRYSAPDHAAGVVRRRVDVAPAGPPCQIRAASCRRPRSPGARQARGGALLGPGAGRVVQGVRVQVLQSPPGT